MTNTNASSFLLSVPNQEDPASCRNRVLLWWKILKAGLCALACESAAG